MRVQSKVADYARAVLRGNKPNPFGEERVLDSLKEKLAEYGVKPEQIVRVEKVLMTKGAVNMEFDEMDLVWDKKTPTLPLSEDLAGSTETDKEAAKNEGSQPKIVDWVVSNARKIWCLHVVGRCYRQP